MPCDVPDEALMRLVNRMDVPIKSRIQGLVDEASRRRKANGVWKPINAFMRAYMGDETACFAMRIAGGCGSCIEPCLYVVRAAKDSYLQGLVKRIRNAPAGDSADVVHAKQLEVLTECAGCVAGEPDPASQASQSPVSGRATSSALPAPLSQPSSQAEAASSLAWAPVTDPARPTKATFIKVPDSPVHTRAARPTESGSPTRERRSTRSAVAVEEATEVKLRVTRARRSSNPPTEPEATSSSAARPSTPAQAEAGPSVGIRVTRASASPKTPVVVGSKGKPPGRREDETSDLEDGMEVDGHGGGQVGDEGAAWLQDLERRERGHQKDVAALRRREEELAEKYGALADRVEAMRDRQKALDLREKDVERREQAVAVAEAEAQPERGRRSEESDRPPNERHGHEPAHSNRKGKQRALDENDIQSQLDHTNAKVEALTNVVGTMVAAYRNVMDSAERANRTLNQPARSDGEAGSSQAPRAEARQRQRSAATKRAADRESSSSSANKRPRTTLTPAGKSRDGSSLPAKRARRGEESPATRRRTRSRAEDLWDEGQAQGQEEDEEVNVLADSSADEYVP